MVFRNRDDELDAVVNALTRSGGRDLWVIVSPPGMGKSWLLNQVHRSLMEKDSGWSERLVDVSEQPRELCTNAGRLLGTLLDVDVADPPDGEPIPDATLRRIAVTVSGRSRQQLYLLDSADRLDPVCAMHLRFAITEVYRRVQVGGNPATRLGMVIATRRPDEWRGLGSNPSRGRPPRRGQVVAQLRGRCSGPRTALEYGRQRSTPASRIFGIAWARMGSASVSSAMARYAPRQ